MLITIKIINFTYESILFNNLIAVCPISLSSAKHSKIIPVQSFLGIGKTIV